MEERRLYDQAVHHIAITDEERQSTTPSLEFIAEAITHLHQDGIIVLDDIIDVAHIDHLNSILTPEALEISNRPSQHFNFGTQTRNMDQAPPPTRELMYKDIWANSFVCAVLAAALGPKPVVHYAMGNTALQAGRDGRQPVHSDIEYNHPVHTPFAYVVNINLIDTTPENGATEVWVGSHHVSTPEAHCVSPNNPDACILQIKPEHLEERRKHSPPIQACTKKGSAIIRDLRLWHAGRPNLTSTPRIMLAFVMQPAWFQATAKVKLPVSVKSLVESWGEEVRFNAEWVEGEVDHKVLSSVDADFSCGSKVVKRDLERSELGRWADYTPRWY